MSPLAYDDSAFNYFALTAVAMCAIPLFFSLLKELLERRKSRHVEEGRKVAKLRQMSGWMMTKIVTVVVLTGLVFYYWKEVGKHSSVAKFDPYAILELERDANVSFIKKQYRRLSLIYHPDKNIGQKAQTASEMFQKIAKAYEALTDEASKENYRLYGNPDGKQAMEISIGLPKFLLKYPKLVMVIYLLFIVLVMPLTVWSWYRNSTKYGGFGVLMETISRWEDYRLVDEVTALKALCMAKEIDELVKTEKVIPHLSNIITTRAKDSSEWIDSELAQLKDLVELKYAKDLKLIYVVAKDNKKKLDKDTSVERIALQCLLGFINRTSISQSDKSINFVGSEVAMQCKKLLPGLYEKALLNGQPGQPTNITMITSVLRASQCMVQALGLKQDPLLQLPGARDHPLAVAAIREKYQDKKAAFKTFLQDAITDKNGLEDIYSKLGLNSKGAIENFKHVCISGFPIINANVSVVGTIAPDESSIAGSTCRNKVVGGDVFSIEVELSYKYHSESVYCPAFLDEVFNNCHLFLTMRHPQAPKDNNGDLDDFIDSPQYFFLLNEATFSADKVSHNDFVYNETTKLKTRVSKKLKHKFDKAEVGTKSFFLWIVNDAVRGLDMLIPVDIEIFANTQQDDDDHGHDHSHDHEHSHHSHAKKNSAWDEVEDDEPGMFSMFNAQAMMQNNPDADYSTDEDEEEEEEEEKKKNKDE